MLGTRQSATESPSWACFRAADPHKIPIDPNGNLTAKTEGTDSWTYTWNAENQLIKVEKNGAEVGRFAYDPLGRRVEKVAGEVTTSYTYDREDIVREVVGGVTLRYVHGPGTDQPVAREDGAGAVTYYHADGLGSVARRTDSLGVAVQDYRYDAWGTIEAGASEPGYAFTGREWDPGVGLYYYRARYYDARGGRFLGEDPIRVASRNAYPYAINNPVSYFDPGGDEAISAVAGGLAAAGTAPAWVGPAAVALTGAVAIGLAWDVGEYVADQLYPPPPVPPVPPTDTTTTAAPALPPTTMVPPLPPIPPSIPMDPPAPTACEAKKPGCQCKCFSVGIMGPPMGRVSSPSKCADICRRAGWSGSVCK